MSGGPYIKDGRLQGAALMNRELAGKCKITCPPLSLPSQSGTAQLSKSTTTFPFDYYSANLEIQYPDGSKEKTFYLPGVTIYNSPRIVGNTIRYPWGFSRGFVAYFDPALKKAYGGATFADRRFSATPDQIWTECRIYQKEKDNPNATNQLEVEVFRTENGQDKRYPYNDLPDFFQRVNVVAVVANVVCTIKLQAEVTKGKDLPEDAEAKPIFIPTKISIKTSVNIPEPVVTGGRKTQSSEVDNAEDSFFKMIESMNAEDPDEDDDEDEDEDVDD